MFFWLIFRNTCWTYQDVEYTELEQFEVDYEAIYSLDVLVCCCVVVLIIALMTLCWCVALVMC